MSIKVNAVEELGAARKRAIELFFKDVYNRAPHKDELEYHSSSGDDLDVVFFNIRVSNYESIQKSTDKLPVSLVIFAKNAENSIHHPIQSVSSVVSEIIVVDTGSTDETIKRAELLGARTYKVGFSDFGSIRTITSHLARQPWVLGLDTDETISPAELPMLKNLIMDANTDVWGLPRRRWADLEMKMQVETEAYPDTQYRLFRNSTDIKFVRRVHEGLEHKGNLKVAAGPHIEHFQDVFKVGDKLKSRNSLYRELYQKDLDDGVEHTCPAVVERDDI